MDYAARMSKPSLKKFFDVGRVRDQCDEKLK